MNPLQKLYDYKSSIIDYEVNQTEYFNNINQIRTRPNQYTFPQEKINIKRNQLFALYS